MRRCAGHSASTWDIPTEVVVTAMETHPADRDLTEVAREHWAAPLAVKPALPTVEVLGASIQKFSLTCATSDKRTGPSPIRTADNRGFTQCILL